jgi:hypothetical protein
MLVSPAGRDDTDDFFAIIVLSVRVNDHQHESDRGLNANRSNCMPALFTGLVIDAILSEEATFVFKD